MSPGYEGIVLKAKTKRYYVALLRDGTVRMIAFSEDMYITDWASSVKAPTGTAGAYLKPVTIAGYRRFGIECYD